METLQIICFAVLSEFSDISNIAEATRITVKLLIAIMLGGLLGYDRALNRKAAGLRTHMLVAAGAALFVLIPAEAGASMADLSRVLQGVIAGVGFLGAGTIIKIVEKETAKGLTTAASIWMTAAIGVAAGMGKGSLAILSTMLALVVLRLAPVVEKNLNKKSKNES